LIEILNVDKKKIGTVVKESIENLIFQLFEVKSQTILKFEILKKERIQTSLNF